MADIPQSTKIAQNRVFRAEGNLAGNTQFLTKVEQKTLRTFCRVGMGRNNQLNIQDMPAGSALV